MNESELQSLETNDLEFLEYNRHPFQLIAEYNVSLLLTIANSVSSFD